MIAKPGLVVFINSHANACPKCGSANGWHRDGRIKAVDLLIAQMGGPKAPVEISVRGGHCLSCGHEEAAVYATEGVENGEIERAGIPA